MRVLFQVVSVSVTANSVLKTGKSVCQPSSVFKK